MKKEGKPKQTRSQIIINNNNNNNTLKKKKNYSLVMYGELSRYAELKAESCDAGSLVVCPAVVYNSSAAKMFTPNNK